MQYTTATKVAPSRAWLYRAEGYDKLTIPGTLSVGPMIADSDAESIYLANNFVPSGTLVARDASGSYPGTWVPWLPNSAAADGEQTVKGILWDGAFVDRDDAGVIIQSVLHVSILPIGVTVMVLPSKMPEYNDHTAFAGGAGSTAAVLTANLPSGAIDVEDLGISGIAGL